MYFLVSSGPAVEQVPETRHHEKKQFCPYLLKQTNNWFFSEGGSEILQSVFFPPVDIRNMLKYKCGLSGVLNIPTNAGKA